jgi:polar amino acid transport system substrate-binding protein
MIVSARMSGVGTHIDVKSIGIGGALLAGVLAFSAAWWGHHRDPSLARLQKAGVLRVGYAVGEPFAVVDAAGEPHGIAVDAIPSLARSLELARVEWVQTSYVELIPDLLDRRFDIVADQLIISPQRQRKVRFSDPVIPVHYSILVRAGDAAAVDPYSRLRPAAGLVVAVVHESLAEVELRARGFTDASLREVPDSDSGEAALQVGSVRALVLTDRAVRAIKKGHPNQFQIVADPVGSTAADAIAWTGYVFHPDDEALRRAWNAALRSHPPQSSTSHGAGS